MRRRGTDGARHPSEQSVPDAPPTIGISRYRTVDAGPRQWDIETDNLRGVVGLRGKFSDWDWEVAAQRARSESEQTGDRSKGWVRTDFLQQQINAGATTRSAACRIRSPSSTQITTSLVRRGKSELTMYDAQISGELFDFGDDAVRMAAGVEYREESGQDVPDDQFQRGLIFGTESVSAAGARDIWSAFVEFAVPLLEGLELSAAVRYDDYSDFGNTTNPKVAVRWAPIDSLAFRASWGTGFRAPSLAQIGLGPSQESQFFIDSFGCADNPVYCAATDYNIIFTGNPNLTAEESETFNVGVAWQPTTASSAERSTTGTSRRTTRSTRAVRLHCTSDDCNNQERAPSASAARRWRATRWARCSDQRERSTTSTSSRRTASISAGYSVRRSAPAR